jgi:hypothetical protein
MAQVISVDVYNFDSAGNAYVSNKVRGIPMPAEFIDLRTTPVSPWQNSGKFVYSKILYQVGGIHKEALTAELVSALIVKANS